tara:strand:- start:2565 stop:2897 length:333 start_codon:yes stop_codon:yes gene_type:complete
MKDKVTILEKTLDESSGQLTVRAEIEPRQKTQEPKIKVFTRDIVDLLNNEYEIEKVIKESMITNIARPHFSTSAEWVFKIKQEQKAPKRPPKPKSSKPAISSRIKKVTKK